MKPDLQRIEAALNQLERQSAAINARVSSEQLLKEDAAIAHHPAPPVSFSVRSLDASAHNPPSHDFNWAANDEMAAPVDAPLSADSQPKHSLQPLFPSLQVNQSPALPKLEMSEFAPVSTDPALVLHITRKLETLVGTWYEELQHLLRRIRAVEAEGPAVNGWLESKPLDMSGPSAATLRHADVDDLMVYVDQLCNQAENSSLPQYSYVLCGYNSNGQVWSRPCSVDELSEVSLAIARYQILAQLKDRQECLEKKLGAIAAQLTHLYQTYVG